MFWFQILPKLTLPFILTDSIKSVQIEQQGWCNHLITILQMLSVSQNLEPVVPMTEMTLPQDCCIIKSRFPLWRLFLEEIVSDYSHLFLTYTVTHQGWDKYLNLMNIVSHIAKRILTTVIYLAYQKRVIHTWFIIPEYFTDFIARSVISEGGIYSKLEYELKT